MEPVWKVELFGGVRAVRGAQVVERFRIQKAAGLLGYLAYNRRYHPRELLIEQFWSDDDLPTARHKLSVALSVLRQVLEPADVGDGAVIETDRNAVRLVPGAVVTDVAELNALLERPAEAPDRAANLGRAVALYRGELLSGFYENWIFTEQSRWAHRFLEALRELIALQVQAGEPSRALESALQAVAADPLSEELHREVMRLHLALDRPGAAMRQYRELERQLREQLDATPSSGCEPLLQAAREALSRPNPDANIPVSGLTHRDTHTPADPPPHAHTDTPQNAVSAVPLTGAVPLDSPLYVVRRADAEVASAIRAGASIVLLKGARQVGKTSLLGRALQQARDDGARIVSTDFQGLSAADLESPGTLLRALAQEIVDQLDLEVDPQASLGPERSPAVGFRRFLRREVLSESATPLVWGLDEVDRLFTCDYHSEIFGLFRSWHNQRVLDPRGPWSRMTQVIAYATEAHLLISDLNQSPFNVGVRIELTDFTAEHVAELNRLYASPLREPEELARFCALVGGQPYLVQQGLSYAARSGGWTALEAAAISDDGPFAEHLRRIRMLLSRFPELREGVRQVLRGLPCAALEDFYRLRSSGILAGPSSEQARLRCPLYAEDLSRHLL